MDFKQLRQSIKKGQFRPVYFLHGEEPFFIDQLAAAIEAHALTEAEKAFNQDILYGKDSDAKQVIDAARSYPMGAERRLVLLREAQDMKTLPDLVRYLQQPLDTTVLVICYKYKKHRLTGDFGKLVKANALIFESKRIYDNQVGGWITNYLADRKRKIEPKAAELVAEYLGTDLSKVTNELEKLILNLPEGTQISDREIEEHIGISREYNVFEFQKALGYDDSAKAFRIVNYFAGNPRKHPLVMVVGALYNYFSKVYTLQGLRAAQKSESAILQALKIPRFFLREYNQVARHYPRRRLERVIQILAEYDLKSKGVDFNATTSDDLALYQELTWKILRGSRIGANRK